MLYPNRPKGSVRLCAEASLCAQNILKLVEEASAFRAFIARFRLAELFEQFALRFAQFRRGFDSDFHYQITAPAPLQNGHSSTALAQLLARLNTLGNIEPNGLAIHIGNANLAAQGSGCETDRSAG